MKILDQLTFVNSSGMTGALVGWQNKGSNAFSGSAANIVYGANNTNGPDLITLPPDNPLGMLVVYQGRIIGEVTEQDPNVPRRIRIKGYTTITIPANTSIYFYQPIIST